MVVLEELLAIVVVVVVVVVVMFLVHNSWLLQQLDGCTLIQGGIFYSAKEEAARRFRECSTRHV